MDTQIVYVILPESLTQILFILFLFFCFILQIFSWRNEKRKLQAIKRIEQAAKHSEDTRKIKEMITNEDA